MLGLAKADLFKKHLCLIFKWIFCGAFDNLIARVHLWTNAFKATHYSFAGNSTEKKFFVTSNGKSQAHTMGQDNSNVGICHAIIY